LPRLQVPGHGCETSRRAYGLLARELIHFEFAASRQQFAPDNGSGRKLPRQHALPEARRYFLRALDNCVFSLRDPRQASVGEMRCGRRHSLFNINQAKAPAVFGLFADSDSEEAVNRRRPRQLQPFIQ
jgi:hypothetical protein